MAKNYDNTNTGALFINHKKTKKRSPNLVGTIDIDGVVRWLSGWTYEIEHGKREGEKMISLAVGDEVEDRGKKRSSKKKKQEEDDDYGDILEDDNPF